MRLSDLDGTDATLDHVVADTLWLKSRPYALFGERERERAVLCEIIRRYRDEVPPRSQLARALYNGIFGARTATRSERSRCGTSCSIDSAPIRLASDRDERVVGQLAKSHVLARSGQLAAALLTCDRMRAECERPNLGPEKVAEIQRT